MQGSRLTSSAWEYSASLWTDKGTGFESDSYNVDWLADALNGNSQWDFSEIWFFGDLIGTLFEFMDRRAARVQKRIAMTEVATQVFDTLDFALAERVMVRIEGSSRFGKTEAMKTWCEMLAGPGSPGERPV